MLEAVIECKLHGVNVKDALSLAARQQFERRADYGIGLLGFALISRLLLDAFSLGSSMLAHRESSGCPVLQRRLYMQSSRIEPHPEQPGLPQDLVARRRLFASGDVGRR